MDAREAEKQARERSQFANREFAFCNPSHGCDQPEPRGRSAHVDKPSRDLQRQLAQVWRLAA